MLLEMSTPFVEFRAVIVDFQSLCEFEIDRARRLNPNTFRFKFPAMASLGQRSWFAFLKTKVPSNHKFRVALMLHSSAEYNRRAATMKRIRAGRSPAEMIRFSGYPRLTVHDVMARNNAPEEFEEASTNPARKACLWERVSITAAVVENMSPHFFVKGQTNTKGVHLRVLQTVVKLCMVS